MLRLRSVPPSFLLSSLLALGVMLPTRGAVAQTPAQETARATDLFKRGKAAFAKGDLAEAEQLFEQALALRKSSDIAANLAQSQLEQQKYKRAAEHFAWALANLLPSATDAQRKAVETGLARSRAEVGVLRLEIKPEGADVMVAEESVGKAPIAGGVFVNPGEVIVSVKSEGFIAIDKRVLVDKATEQAVTIELKRSDLTPVVAAAPQPVASAPPPEAAPDQAGHKSLVPAVVVTGVAVAGVAVGVVFTLSANSKEDEADALRDDLGPGACSEGGSGSQAQCDELKSQRESVDSARGVALGAFVVGGVAAVVAGYLFWDALSQPSSGAARAVGPLRALRPRLDVTRADAAGSFDSVKLGLSGTF